MRNPRIEELFSGLARSAALQTLIQRLDGAGAKTLRLSGLTLTAKAAYSALLYRATNRPQILITDGNKQAEALFPAIATFCGLLEVQRIHRCFCPRSMFCLARECHRTPIFSPRARKRSDECRAGGRELS